MSLYWPFPKNYGDLLNPSSFSDNTTFLVHRLLNIAVDQFSWSGLVSDQSLRRPQRKRTFQIIFQLLGYLKFYGPKQNILIIQFDRKIISMIISDRRGDRNSQRFFLTRLIRGLFQIITQSGPKIPYLATSTISYIFNLNAFTTR